jgi:toxin FitB
MNYLLDTCIVSELIAKQPNQTVLNWLDAQVPTDLYLSVITIGELTRGISRLPTSRRKSTLENWLNADLLSRFSNRIPVLDLATMQLWGHLIGNLEPRGRVLPLMDSLIAAIALQGSFCLVTRNEKDFEGTGVTIINPFIL